MAKKHFSFLLRVRCIIFQYKDVPKEFHAVCLETGSFGVGANQFAAIQSLNSSINAQIDEDLTSVGFTPEVDPEWDAVWRGEKHPACDDVVVLLRLKGTIAVQAERHSAKAAFQDDFEVAKGNTVVSNREEQFA